MSESSNPLAREPARTLAVRYTDTTTHPPLDAEDAAETVLRAFYAQDERDASLRAGEMDAAAAAAETARGKMARAFVCEFPHLPERRAALAGIRFVEALFVQDEIENRAALAAVADTGELDRSLLETAIEFDDGPLLDDPRWDIVERYLEEVCAHADIDESYAAAQTRFWKLHGQGIDWIDAAATAHRIKVEAMLDGADASPADVARLADYFVAGVAAHDQWTDDEVESVGGIVGLVTTYYEELSSLRADERCVD